jgi:hypothetical protein
MEKRISELDAALVLELTDTTVLVVNVPDGSGGEVTKRTTWGELKQYATCETICFERTFTPAELFLIHGTPEAFGITVPTGYGILVVGGFVNIDFNTTAYSGGGASADLIIQTLTNLTEIATMTSLMGTVTDANGVIEVTPVNPMEKRVYLNEDVYLTHSGAGEYTFGDSDVLIKLFYKLIQF